MNRIIARPAESTDAEEVSSFLILEDGRVLARNVTPAMAALLFTLAPDNRELGLRAGIPRQVDPTFVNSSNSE
jgi:hypothetical protein